MTTAIHPQRNLAMRAESVLRGSASHKVDMSALIQIILMAIACGAIYGAVMGTSAGCRDGHWIQIVYSAVKVPLLLGATFTLSVPSYFVFYSLFGLRSAFFQAMSAILTAQAGVAITLASLSPFTALWYASLTDYQSRVLFNGAMFAIATIAGQVLIRRYYKVLIEQNRRHLLLLRLWMYVYFFVGIQMGWTLRPFVGEPSLAPHFSARKCGETPISLWAE
jgi:hypothetical protein